MPFFLSSSAVPDFIERLRDAKIIGRGGAEYPAHLKWTAVKHAKGRYKTVIANASEREPDVFKDFHVLHKHLEDVFKGMMLAMETVSAFEGIFNLNAEYESKLKPRFDACIADAAKNGFKIRLFEEFPSYIGGEETALLNAFEGKRCEPRMKPPYPTESGYRGRPTLIHNVETLYDISRVADGTYDGKRYFAVSGVVPNIGTYHLPATSTVWEVLESSKNIPAEPFFVQVGGGASGVVLNSDQTKKEVAHGAAAIIVHLQSEEPRSLILQWLEFYHHESCGKCTPCREGTYQLLRMVEEHQEIPWKRMEPILEVLEQTSFCALGRSVPVPIRSYFSNVLHGK